MAAYLHEKTASAASSRSSHVGLLRNAIDTNGIARADATSISMTTSSAAAGHKEEIRRSQSL
jgi:hypothetical protein